MVKLIYFRVDPKISGFEKEWLHWIKLWEIEFPLCRMEVELLMFENSKEMNQARCDNFFLSKKLKDKSSSILLNLTSPEHFYHTEAVTCGGLFLGNTESIPAKWLEKFRTMDFIIAFSEWNSNVIKRLMPEKKIFTVPFPIALEGKVVPSIPISLYDVDLAILKDDYRFSAIDLPQSFQQYPLFFAETRLSPLDGIPILISEWFRFMKKGGLGSLVISIDFKRLGERKDEKIRDFIDMAFRLMRRNSLSRSTIYFISDASSNGHSIGEKTWFFSIVDAVVLPSHEGGLLSENTTALLEMEKPIIAPRHSDVADIIPSDYPLTLSWKSENCSFDDEENMVPLTAHWFVIEEGSLVEAMDQFCIMSEETRKEFARNVKKMVNLRYSERTILDAIKSFAGEFL